METHHSQYIHIVANVIEIAGLAVIVFGGGFGVLRFFKNLATRKESYKVLRKDLGRSILLGLEFLVAGDIISTITIEPTLESVTVLGLIVLIRTFLSFSLELEITGRWPWQSEDAASSSVIHSPT